MDGDPYLLPRHSVVTGRATPGSPPERHYGLVCRSEFSLTERAEELWIHNADLRNLRSDALVGSSQVTSVVRHLSRGQRGQRKYTVAFSATLESPYLIKLKDCILEMTKNVDEEVRVRKALENYVIEITLVLLGSIVATFEAVFRQREYCPNCWILLAACFSLSVVAIRLEIASQIGDMNEDEVYLCLYPGSKMAARAATGIEQTRLQYSSWANGVRHVKRESYSRLSDTSTRQGDCFSSGNTSCERPRRLKTCG